MLDYGAKNYEIMMNNAASFGHIKIVQLMLNCGAKNYDEAMNLAMRENHVDIIELLTPLWIESRSVD